MFASVGAFLQNCERLKAREDAFDLILSNHNGTPIAKSYLDDFITAARHVVEGHPDIVPLEGGYRYPFFGERSVRVRVGDSCINYLVRYGTEAVAAMGAAGKATLVISMVQMGLCMGVQPMLAYSYGARNLARLRETLWELGILTLSVGAALTLLCLFNSRSIISLFLKEDAALELGQRMVRLLVMAGPFLGLFYLSSSLLQASGKAALATFVSTLRQGILLVPMLYIMNYFFGVTGNIWAHIVADISSALVASLLALWQCRKLMEPGQKDMNHDG